MGKYCTLASLVSKNNTLTSMLQKLANSDGSPAYILLSSIDNESLKKSAFFTLPRYILRELELLCQASPINLYLEVVHPLATTTIDGYDHFITFKNLEKSHANKLPKEYAQWMLKLEGHFCRVIRNYAPLTPKQLSEAGYSPGYISIMMAFAASNIDIKPIENVCSITKIKISADAIFVGSDSALVKNYHENEEKNALFAQYPFLDSNHPAYSTTLNLALNVKKALDIDQKGNVKIGYHKRVEGWLKDKKAGLSKNMIEYIASVISSDK